jgi:hypothetical protein
MVMPINSDVDGQVWIGGDNEYQVDVKTASGRRLITASASRTPPS